MYCALVSRRVDGIIFDEAHVLTNPQTRLWKTANLLLCQAFNSVKVLMLTGTPLKNSVADIGVLISMLDHWGGAVSDFEVKEHM
jgi:SNF2 family DNA or RNA helicase